MLAAQSGGNPTKGGAHTAFKENLKADLHSRVTKTVRVRAGPSWDERMDKAVKAFGAKSRASEAEMKKNLVEAVERGRSRPTSCPIRSASETPNQFAMLQQRKAEMKEKEAQYREHLDSLRDKMEKREPLFRLSNVSSAFEEQRQRMLERKRQMAQDEHERWEHLKSLEVTAASRPMLIEDPTYKPQKKAGLSQSSPNLQEGGGTAAADGHKTGLNPAVFGGREEYAKDVKIREAVNSRWYQQTDWAKKVAEIRDRADNRQKLHEIQYPNKGDRHALTRNRLMHTLPCTVPGVF